MYVCLSLNYYSKKSMEIMELPQERTHARSEEEDDQLEISNKKVRAGGSKQEPSLHNVEMSIAEQRGVSFRDKLLGRTAMPTADDPEEWISDEEEQPDPDCPIIQLSKEEKTRIHMPWKQSLIVKLLGWNIDYRLLLRKIRDLWKPKVVLDLIAMDN